MGEVILTKSRYLSTIASNYDIPKNKINYSGGSYKGTKYPSYSSWKSQTAQAYEARQAAKLQAEIEANRTAIQSSQTEQVVLKKEGMQATDPNAYRVLTKDQALALDNLDEYGVTTIDKYNMAKGLDLDEPAPHMGTPSTVDPASSIQAKQAASSTGTVAFSDLTEQEKAYIRKDDTVGSNYAYEDGLTQSELIQREQKQQQLDLIQENLSLQPGYAKTALEMQEGTLKTDSDVVIMNGEIMTAGAAAAMQAKQQQDYEKEIAQVISTGRNITYSADDDITRQAVQKAHAEKLSQDIGKTMGMAPYSKRIAIEGEPALVTSLQTNASPFVSKISPIPSLLIQKDPAQTDAQAMTQFQDMQRQGLGQVVTIKKTDPYPTGTVISQRSDGRTTIYTVLDQKTQDKVNKVVEDSRNAIRMTGTVDVAPEVPLWKKVAGNIEYHGVQLLTQGQYTSIEDWKISHGENVLPILKGKEGIEEQKIMIMSSAAGAFQTLREWESIPAEKLGISSALGKAEKWLSGKADKLYYEGELLRSWSHLSPDTSGSKIQQVQQNATNNGLNKNSPVKHDKVEDSGFINVIQNIGETGAALTFGGASTVVKFGKDVADAPVTMGATIWGIGKGIQVVSKGAGIAGNAILPAAIASKAEPFVAKGLGGAVLMSYAGAEAIQSDKPVRTFVETVGGLGGLAVGAKASGRVVQYEKFEVPTVDGKATIRSVGVFGRPVVTMTKSPTQTSVKSIFTKTSKGYDIQIGSKKFQVMETTKLPEDTLGDYDLGTGSIRIQKGLDKAKLQDTALHEIGHKIDIEYLGNSKYTFSQMKRPSKVERDFLKEYAKKEYAEDYSPAQFEQELKADILAQYLQGRPLGKIPTVEHNLNILSRQIGLLNTKPQIKVQVGRANLASELKAMPEGAEIKPAGILETQLYKNTLKDIGTTERAQVALGLGQSMISQTKGVKSKFITEEAWKTERLTAEQTQVLLDLARAEGAVIFGSGARRVQMPESISDFLPRDVDIRLADASPKNVERVRLKAFEGLQRKGAEVRLAKDKPEAIEVLTPEGWRKAAEFKGPGQLDPDLVPDKVLGFQKEGTPITISKNKYTALEEEFRGVSQGVFRVRMTEGELDVYPSPKRVKDITSVDIAGETLAKSKRFGRAKLEKDLELFRRLYRPSGEASEVMLADFSPTRSPTTKPVIPLIGSPVSEISVSSGTSLLLLQESSPIVSEVSQTSEQLLSFSSPSQISIAQKVDILSSPSMTSSSRSNSSNASPSASLYELASTISSQSSSPTSSPTASLAELSSIAGGSPGTSPLTSISPTAPSPSPNSRSLSPSLFSGSPNASISKSPDSGSPSPNIFSPPKDEPGKAALWWYKKRKQKMVDAFNVLVRVRNQWKKLNTKGLDKDSALSLGAKFAGSTAAATYKLQQTKELIRQPSRRDMFHKLVAHKFRQKIGRSGEILNIEKTQYRIDTPGEIQGITVQGLLAQKNRNPAASMFNHMLGGRKNVRII